MAGRRELVNSRSEYPDGRVVERLSDGTTRTLMPRNTPTPTLPQPPPPPPPIKLEQPTLVIQTNFLMFNPEKQSFVFEFGYVAAGANTK